MKEYRSYDENLKLGKKYEDFIKCILKEKFNYNLHPYKTKEGQYEFGENKEGIEIKYDNIMKRTGNIYIEIAEKTNKNNLNFIPSGIYRNDNSIWYLIGDYQTIYIFKIKDLRQAYEDEYYYMLKENPTSKGFLLSKIQARILANKLYTII
ncbi:hypothetical protein ES705_50331 [subsurface metagenome]